MVPVLFGPGTINADSLVGAGNGNTPEVLFFGRAPDFTAHYGAYGTRKRSVTIDTDESRCFG